MSRRGNPKNLGEGFLETFSLFKNRVCLLCEYDYIHFATLFCRNPYDSSESDPDSDEEEEDDESTKKKRKKKTKVCL